jgi:hypothetical protein
MQIQAAQSIAQLMQKRCACRARYLWLRNSSLGHHVERGPDHSSMVRVGAFEGGSCLLLTSKPNCGFG